MAKQKKNSNYQTDKAIAKKAQKEEEKQKEQQAKNIKLAAIIAGSSAAFIALIIIILFAVGAFDYHPEPTYHATVTLDSGESLHVELYGNDAPETVKSFIELAEDGYFDGMYLHTFADGLLYGGSKNADQGENGITGEFSDNGKENKILMKKGVVCMARGEDYDSGFGQFFILTSDRSDLYGKYAAFGKVTEMDALDKILSSIKTDSEGNIIDSTAPRITSISLHAAH